jgi:hypothetical protein
MMPQHWLIVFIICMLIERISHHIMISIHGFQCLFSLKDSKILCFLMHAYQWCLCDDAAAHMRVKWCSCDDARQSR